MTFKIIAIAALITSLAIPARADYYSDSIQQQNYQNQMQAEQDNMRQVQYQRDQEMQRDMQRQQDQINRINNESPAARMGGCC